jgi:hypothetical protein
MIDRAFDFKAVLDRAAGARANCIFLGDLKSMGLDYLYGRAEPRSRSLLCAQATAEQKIGRLAYVAKRQGMRVVTKTRRNLARRSPQAEQPRPRGRGRPSPLRRHGRWQRGRRMRLARAERPGVG